MIDTLEGIKNHPLFSNVETLKASIDELAGASEDLEFKARKVRLSGLAKILDANIKGSQEIFTPSYAIEEAHQHIQNGLNQLSSYKGNLQVSHLHAAIRDIENAIRVYAAPFRIRERKLLDEYVDKILEVSEQQTQKVHAFMSELDEKQATLTDEMTDVSEKVASHKLELERLRAEMNSAISNLNEEFQKRQVERSSAFSDQLQKFNERTTIVLDEKAQEASEAVDKKEKEISELIGGFKQRFEDTLTESKDIREQIRKLAGLAGTEALVGRFHKVGQDQRNAAGLYRFIAYIGFLATAIYMAYTVYITQQREYNGTLLEAMIAKSQLALFLLIPSTFLAIELRRLNRSQARLQELELLISAFGPFVDDLPPDEKNRLKQTMAPVFFKADGSQSDKEPSITDEQIKLFQEILKIGKS